MKLYRPVTVLVGVLLVIVGGLVRLGEPKHVLDDANRRQVTSSIGQTVTGDDFAFTVHRIRLVRSVLKNADDEEDEAIRTDGVFVVIDFDASGVRLPNQIGQMTLKTDKDTEYAAATNLGTGFLKTPEPGFTTTESTVFEVNPADLVGLRLMISPGGLITYFATDYVVDLGIPSERIAAELVKGAAETHVLADETTRVTE